MRGCLGSKLLKKVSSDGVVKMLYLFVVAVVKNDKNSLKLCWHVVTGKTMKTVHSSHGFKLTKNDHIRNGLKRRLIFNSGGS